MQDGLGKAGTCAKVHSTPMNWIETDLSRRFNKHSLGTPSMVGIKQLQISTGRRLDSLRQFKSADFLRISSRSRERVSLYHRVVSDGFAAVIGRF